MADRTYTFYVSARNKGLCPHLKYHAFHAWMFIEHIGVTLTVQAARFANNVNRRMKGVLYANLVWESRSALEDEGAGELVTKVISDDNCAEGMRKFTTKVFDTGVALAGYVAMLLAYDWRLALLCLIFPPVSYLCAERMKKPVQRAGSACKKAAADLNAATLDREKCRDLPYLRMRGGAGGAL